LGMLADALARQLNENPIQRELAGKVAAGIQRVHDQVRDLCRELVLTDLDAEELCTALRDLAARVSDQTGIRCAFDLSDSVQMKSPTTAKHLYRIAQEAVSNAVRHGHPEHIRLELRSTRSGLRMCIEDDGSGMPSSGGYPWESRGLGLSTMRYRANLIGGLLHITPADGKGVRVVCVVPQENDDAEE